MSYYNYMDAVTDDVREYIENEVDLSEWVGNADGLEEWLNDTLWVCDSVTGNASGSYTCNSWQAEEYLMHNLDVLAEAIEEFGGDIDILKDGAEACDVTIRCYLLGRAIAEVMEDITEELEEMEENENDYQTI